MSPRPIVQSASVREFIQTPRVVPFAFLPAVLTGGAVLVALLATQTPLADVARYAAYLLFAVLIPGTLVHRALRGRSSLLVAELALGGATGLALELIAWAAFTALHIQAFLWAWPLIVVVPFVVVPSLRSCWRQPGSVGTERSRALAWLLAAGFSFFTLSMAVTSMRTSGLPPNANLYYEDVYWHLANAVELTRQVPPDVPQVAGRTLRYHWFSNAHMAASHLISGVDLPTIILRLWLLPVVAIVLGLTATVARKATGLAWPGGVAALIVVAPAQLIPWPWFSPFTSAALIGGSPSQVFGLVFLLLAADVLLDIARGRPLGRGWVVLLLAASAAPGSKPSVLPILLGGLLCVIVLKLLQRRSVGRLPIAGLLMVASVGAMSPLVAQSAAGSGLKVLGILVWNKVWNPYVGVNRLPGTGGPIISGLGAPGAVVLALLLGAALLLQYVWVLAGLPLLRRRTRGDPAAWFLAGCVLAGLVATMVVDHPGASEIYFAKTATPLAAILAAWGLAVALPVGSLRAVRRTAVALAVGAAAGSGLVLLAVLTAPRRPANVSGVPSALAVPFVVLLLGSLVGAAIWWLLRLTRWRALKGMGLAVVCAALVVGSLVQGPQSTVLRVRAAMAGTAVTQKPWAISAEEASAALWVARNVPPDDVVATNVHCITKVTRPNCAARAFWVSALGEHRVLVEGWAYTEEALLQQGRGGRGFLTQPFDDPVLFAANEAAFADPTAGGLARLRDEHGVRWLFADRLAGPVSPRLSKLARLRFSTADVQVFELSGR